MNSVDVLNLLILQWDLHYKYKIIYTNLWFAKLNHETGQTRAAAAACQILVNKFIFKYNIGMVLIDEYSLFYKQNYSGMCLYCLLLSAAAAAAAAHTKPNDFLSIFIRWFITNKKWESTKSSLYRCIKMLKRTEYFLLIFFLCRLIELLQAIQKLAYYSIGWWWLCCGFCCRWCYSESMRERAYEFIVDII